MHETAPDPAPNELVPLDEERAVIERLQAGDRTAFATLYGWYGERLYRQVIWPRVGSREAAEDVLRETFRIALEKIGTFTYDGKSVFFWLRRIAINRAIDVHRAHRRDRDLADKVRAQPTEVLHQAPPRPDRGLEVEDLRGQVEISLSRMNDRYAAALRLRLLEDRTREECAELLEVKVGTFDVLLHRACKAFKKVFPP